MDSDDRKLISKWLGYHEDKLDNAYYCPEDNHSQFKEIWNKLTDVDLIRLIFDKLEMNEPMNSSYGDVINIINLFITDLPKICQAVIEVIKEGESGN